MTTAGGSIRPKGAFKDLPGDHVLRYLWVSQFAQHKTVLDAGCGHGYGSYYLSDGIARSVLAIDNDVDAIEFASQNYHGDNLEFRVMDVTKLILEPNSFDVVISFEVIEHLRDVKDYLEGVKNILKPSGLFVLSTPNKEYTIKTYTSGRSINPFHVREYNPSELIDLLGKYFTVKGVYAEFSDVDLRSRTQEFRDYAYGCRMPRVLRRLFPNSVKNMWLKMKGLQRPLPRENFRIEIVKDGDKFDDTLPVQLVLCEKG